MSFETGTATSKEDLLVKWFNFLQANGWTADVDWVSTGQSPAWGIIKRQVNSSPMDPQTVNLYCAFAAADANTDGEHMNMIPMRDYVSGDPQDAVEVATSIGDYDSVSGSTHIFTNFPSKPFENYWFFESDYYAHAVVEYAAGKFRHFGMGQLNKIGKWYGGEYYYGSYWNQGTSFIEAEVYNGHRVGLDSVTNFASIASVVYGQLSPGVPFPDVAGRQSPESAWHAFSSGVDVGSGIGNDADGRDRGGLMANGPRGGRHYPLYWNGQIPFNGYRPMYPIHVMTRYGGVTPDNVVPLGTQPDVRTMSMAGALQPGDEFTVGSDTWIVFPVASKREPKVFDDTEQSRAFGIAYKKVLT